MECSDSYSYSEYDDTSRTVPSFLEPPPPLISNPFMRPRPDKGTNLLELFESDCQEPELVQVYLRLKPCNVPLSNNLYEVRSDQTLITSLDTTTMGHGRRTQQNVSKMYNFSHVFRPECTQKEIFERVIKENLKKLPDGHNFTLLTYGASGSGKTYTLMGTVAAPGLVPRSLEYVFGMVDVAQQPLFKPSDGGTEKLSYNEQTFELEWVKNLRKISAPVRNKYKRMSTHLHNEFTVSTTDLSNHTKYYLWVSFIEIYNEAVFDLLVSADRRTASKLRIREDASGNFYVEGATQAFVRSGQEAYDVMVAGKHNLRVAATGVHAQSSRSHCIFTITMLTEMDGQTRTSAVRLCDLAGCERAARTRNTGARMQESRAINTSLHVLERCLRVLRTNRAHALDPARVPYRESKLTRLLGAGLCGRGESVGMVVTVNPAPDSLTETRHVLQFATVAKDIQVNSTMAEFESLENTSRDTTMGSNPELMKLRAENERLKFELLQFEIRIKEMQASKAEKQQEKANTMKALVKEAEDITRQFYEEQMRCLKSEMEEMKEDYEQKLKMAKCESGDSHGPQRKVTQLMMEITLLEEKLNAERLARATVEEEMLHLRACIEERDEKRLLPRTEVVELTDSEDESDEDSANESLEPTFKKENINRSRVRQSLRKQDVDITAESESDSDNTSTIRESMYVTDDFTNATDTDDTQSDDDSRHSDSKVSTVKKITKVNRSKDTDFDDSSTKSNSCRGTYFVKDSGFISPDVHVNVDDESTQKIIDIKNKTSIVKLSRTTTLIQSSDVSLLQFEQLEREARNSKHTLNENSILSNIKMLTEKRTYFDDKTQNNDSVKEKRSIVDNNDPCVNKSDETSINDRANEINDETKNNNESSVDKNIIPTDQKLSASKKLLNDDLTKLEALSSGYKKSLSKIHLSMDMFESPNTGAKVNELITKSVEKHTPIKENQLKIVDQIRNETTSSMENHTQIKENQLHNVHQVRIETTTSMEKLTPLKKNQLKNVDQIKIETTTLTNKTSEEPVKEITIIEDINQLHITNSEGNNTTDYFETLSKDITARETEFEMLVSSSTTTKADKSYDKCNNKSLERQKYNLRKNVNSANENDDPVTEALPESNAKCDIKVKSTKKKLTLRRQKKMENDSYKLKDIANLQEEFSDVVLDIPAPNRERKDINSPKTVTKNEENASVLFGMSCPSKSITRSRRKLFTPQPDSLELSMGNTGDSNEPIAVPRPSYHRTTRARRKL